MKSFFFHITPYVYTYIAQCTIGHSFGANCELGNIYVGNLTLLQVYSKLLSTNYLTGIHVYSVRVRWKISIVSINVFNLVRSPAITAKIRQFNAFQRSNSPRAIIALR